MIMASTVGSFQDTTCLQAEEEFVEMRKEMLETKQALEETVREHKELVKNVRAAEIKVKVQSS